MPTYRYRCTTCGEELEVWQSITDAALKEHLGVGENVECGGDLVKVFSAAGIVLKGSGFYKTDSRSNGKGATRESKSDAGSKTGDSSSSSDKKSSDAKTSDGGASTTSDSGSSASTSSSSKST